LKKKCLIENLKPPVTVPKDSSQENELAVTWAELKLTPRTTKRMPLTSPVSSDTRLV